ncbi:MAG: DUF3137 domain-containing protein [Verrucomicrobiales bacterium]|nr:DUF3137 domain-containing protein [Verrucomicrobiales bacterium]
MRDLDSIITELRPTLEALEPQRLEYKKKSATFLLVIGCIVGALVIAGLATQRMIPFLIGAAVAAVISILIFSFTVGKQRGAYLMAFKSAVIPRVLNLIDSGLGFDPNRGIGSDTFRYSELFTTSPDRYQSEDLVWGSYGKTEIQLAEIHAEDRRTRTRDGKTETYYVTIFQGLLLIADFHKHFQGRTFVLPDNAEKLLGRFGRGLQKLAGRSGTKLVQLEDPEFERTFAIYSNDQVECRYILSTSMMRRILDMKNRFGKDDVRIAFKDSSVWIAIPHTGSYLEPKIGVAAMDPTQIRQMLGELQAFLAIVEELNLNTRIWTKE